MATITIAVADRHDFHRLWREFTDEQASAARQNAYDAPGATITVDPVQQGPGPDGRLTLLGVEPEGLDLLRSKHFAFREIV